MWLKEIGRWTARNQIGVQHDFILQAHTLTNDLRPPGNLSAQGLRGIIGNPDLGQEPAGIELRQDRGFDLVRLHARFRDEPPLKRIRDDHPCLVRPHRIPDCRRIAGRLKHDMIRRT